MEDENCMEWPTGTRICKEFDGEAYEGKVEKIHRSKGDDLLYHVVYEDGDSEDMDAEVS